MRSKLILIAAIIMGLLTTYLFFGYMKQYDGVSTANETLTEVVSAKQAIKKNQVLSPDLLQVVKVPKMGVHADAVVSISDAQGKLATADIAAGETLLKHRLGSPQDEKLFVSRKVKEGYRAVSVGVNFVQSVSNLIEPEDLVDVVLTVEEKNAGGGGNFVTSMVIEKVRVLAIGRRMEEATKDTPYAEYSAVTLEVKPENVMSVINADEKGSVTLTLHSKANQTAAK